MSTISPIVKLEFFIKATIDNNNNKITSSSTTLINKGIKNSIGMIRSDENFEPDFKYLDKLWISPENSIKRQWYVQTYSLKDRISFRENWCKDMKRIKCNIEFFKWFEYTGKLDDHNTTKSTDEIITSEE